MSVLRRLGCTLVGAIGLFILTVVCWSLYLTATTTPPVLHGIYAAPVRHVPVASPPYPYDVRWDPFHLNYLIGPDAAHPVNLTALQPTDKAAACELFLTALELSLAVGEEATGDFSLGVENLNPLTLRLYSKRRTASRPLTRAEACESDAARAAARCPFCKKISFLRTTGTLSSAARVVVFDDIAPRSASHKLVVPVDHALTNLRHFDRHNPEHVETLWECITVMGLYAQQYGSLGHIIFHTNAGAHSFQSVFHMHIHLRAGEFRYPFGIFLEQIGRLQLPVSGALSAPGKLWSV